MNGIDLKELEASDMTDVLHYFFEEDLFYSSYEQAEGRDKAREHIYRDFYQKSYPYAAPRSSSNGQGVSRNFDIDLASEDEEITPFDPLQKKTPTKPYMAPTQVDARSTNPFGNSIDGPMSRD